MIFADLVAFLTECAEAMRRERDAARAGEFAHNYPEMAKRVSDQMYDAGTISYTEVRFDFVA